LNQLEIPLSNLPRISKSGPIPTLTTLAAFKLLADFEHHLPGPIVAFNEPGALAVGRIGAERAAYIGAGWAVVILDQRIDLIAFEICQLTPA
jgi:hypothetical protein